MDELKLKLNHVFKALRKRGLIARQRFCCCGTCAGTRIADELHEKLQKGSKVSTKGAVFYTKQGFDVFSESLSRLDKIARYRDVKDEPRPRLYLRFGPIHVHNYKTLGLPASEIGVMVTEELRRVGLEFRWDGSGEHTIEVLG